jgi:hypothetical protein
MTAQKSRTQIASAVSLALSSMMLAGGLNAGVINNSNNTLDSLVDTDGSFLGACGTTDMALEACVDAWDLTNVDVEVVNADNIAQIVGTFDPVTGTYTGSGLNGVMTYGDSFRSYVKDAAGTRVARVSGKDWPVGEPTGIKAVVDDAGVTNGNPQNCIINTSYLDGADDSDPTTDPNAIPPQTSYLDTDKPEPVICSSAFQTHKRFKIAMLDTTVAGVDAGKPGKPIDMVFNVTDDASGLRYYQVFSKINNYTGVRLKGYMIQVGTGTGDAFQTASEAGIADRLQLSRGIGDYLDTTVTPPVYSGSDLWTDDQMATYSSGLFGRADKHFPTDGFFDNQAAGFLVGEGCSSKSDPNLDITVSACANSDTLYSTGPLNVDTADGLDTKDSFYYAYFGNWPHQNLTPRGIFHDFDNDPTTDADLVAWWNGTQWMKPDNLGTVSTADATPSVFVPVSATELNTWANDRSCYEKTKSCYSVGVIEDVLNLGLNYVVKVGDDIDQNNNPATGASQITVRIIPVVADNPTESGPWVANLPAEGELLPVPDTTTTTSSGGGGCAVGGSGRIDPTLPALLAMGLGFFGWRRFKAGK